MRFKVTQSTSARLTNDSHDPGSERVAPQVKSPALPPTVASPQPSFADQLGQLTAQDSNSETEATSANSRPLVWALVATVAWFAIIVGGAVALARSGKFAVIDATTVAAYAAGIFTPVTAFWLAALAVMRGGILSSEHERTAKAIGELVTPIDAARSRAVHLANALEMQILRMSAAADAAEAKATALDTAAQREADKLVAAGDALDVFQLQVDKATDRLQDIMAQAQGLIGRLEAVLPEAARRLSAAVSDAATQSEALTTASVKVVDASTLARQAAEGVMPSFMAAVTRLDEAGDRIAERLSLLEIQAAAASRAMDSSAEKASDTLENSRNWVEQQIATIDSSVSRVESDVVRRLETLTLSLGESSAQMERNMPAMVTTLSNQMLAIENSMKAWMEEITTSFAATVDGWENASMASSVQLVDAMSRARAMSNEATNAAREATAGIMSSVEAALNRATDGAQATVAASLQQLQNQAEDISRLAQQSEDRNTSLRAALEDKVNQDFAKTADQLIDRMNAYAVDITKIYSGDVTEHELRDYLKGDRTLFVRRFAKNMSGLGNRSESRKIVSQISERLESEPEFADLTRRYLTSFEALLKLGQHRGEQDALTVSLLTSDLGKMYVALARAAGRMN
jgi:hypothetical protein